MTSRKLIPSILTIGLLLTLYSGAPPAAADSSHARIIRLSLVQGDVRFAREAHGDPLANSNATWETAGLNLPIRQGYVLATDKGRAEVEFENGTVAFLKENTVLEFYDLSLRDESRTTRLVLRQGSASFYVNPAGSDYFSVTGGDFTVEADSRSTFRIDNYDDGSTVENFKGHVSVLRNKNATRLDKGQSLTVKAATILLRVSPTSPLKTTSIAGFLAASTASPPPPLRRCNTLVLPITLRDLPISTPMAPLIPVAPMATAGNRLELALAGPPSRMDNGSWIPRLAGLG